MNYKYIHVLKDDFKMLLTLNRPSKRNAFTPTMVNEIRHAFEEANTDDTIKVVIINAEGPVFCAGMDLKTFENPDLDCLNPDLVNIDISLGEVFDQLNKPSIAVVEGNVIAGGFLIILGCTYVFCNPDTQFRLPELALNIFPFQVMASLLKVMSEKKVLQLCLNTAYFSAEKARELGIVDGYLEDQNCENLILSFKDVSTKALTAGIQSIRDVQNVASKDRFAFLKSILDNLKNQ